MGDDLSVYVCNHRPQTRPLTFRMSWSAYSFHETHII